MKMFAQVTREGTACSETALCDRHIDRKDEFTYAGHESDSPAPGHVDCSGNEALECQVCGGRSA